MKRHSFLFLLLLAAHAGYAQIADVDTTSAMTRDTFQLGEVSVVTSRMMPRSDGYEMNLVNLPQVKDMDVTEVLRYMPGMVVSEGRMTVNGKNVARVYVNKRLIRMTGAELQEYLRSLGPGRVKSIRVITDPGAEMSARDAGSAIVKITLTRQADGGMLRLRGDELKSKNIDRLTVPDGSLQLRNGRWSFYGSEGITRHTFSSTSDATNLFTSTGTTINNHSRTKWKTNSQNYTASIGYDITEKDIVTVEHTYSHGKTTDRGQNYNSVTQTLADGTTSTYRDLTDKASQNNRLGLTADYLHEWKTGELTGSGAYTHNHSHNEQMAWREDDPDLWQNGSISRTSYSLWQAQADVTQKLPRPYGELQYGAEMNIWRSHFNTDGQLLQGLDKVLDISGTDRFLYRESTLAAYAKYSVTVKKLSLSVGLRYEHLLVDPKSEWPSLPSASGSTSLAGEQSGNSYRSRYDWLYPSASLGYWLNTTRRYYLRLSYTRKLVPASMYTMNPARRWNNEYSYSTGNPWLRPDNGNTVSATLSLGNSITVHGSYSLTPTVMTIYGKEAESDIYYTTYDNGGSVRSWSGGASGNKILGKRAMLNGSLQVNHTREHYNHETVSSTALAANFTANYRLDHGWSTALSGYYNAPIRFATYRQGALAVASLAVNKLFLKHWYASLTYSVAPPPTMKIYADGMRGRTETNNSIHRVALSLRYTLSWGNNQKIRRSQSAGTQERSRMTGGDL